MLQAFPQKHVGGATVGIKAKGARDAPLLDVVSIAIAITNDERNYNTMADYVISIDAGNGGTNAVGGLRLALSRQLA